MLPNRWNIFRTLLVHFILIHKSDSQIRYFAVLFHSFRYYSPKWCYILRQWNPTVVFTSPTTQSNLCEPIRNRGQSGQIQITDWPWRVSRLTNQIRTNQSITVNIITFNERRPRATAVYKEPIAENLIIKITQFWKFLLITKIIIKFFLMLNSPFLQE